MKYMKKIYENASSKMKNLKSILCGDMIHESNGEKLESTVRELKENIKLTENNRKLEIYWKFIGRFGEYSNNPDIKEKCNTRIYIFKEFNQKRLNLDTENLKKIEECLDGILENLLLYTEKIYKNFIKKDEEYNKIMLSLDNNFSKCYSIIDSIEENSVEKRDNYTILQIKSKLKEIEKRLIDYSKEELLIELENLIQLTCEMIERIENIEVKENLNQLLKLEQIINNDIRKNLIKEHDKIVIYNIVVILNALVNYDKIEKKNILYDNEVINEKYNELGENTNLQIRKVISKFERMLEELVSNTIDNTEEMVKELEIMLIKDGFISDKTIDYIMNLAKNNRRI